MNSIIIANTSYRVVSPRFTISERVTCNMQFLPGASALSAFKQAKLLASLQTICPKLLAISARYIHLFDVAEPLSAPDQHTPSRLLEYGEPYEQPCEERKPVMRLLISNVWWFPDWGPSLPGPVKPLIFCKIAGDSGQAGRMKLFRLCLPARRIDCSQCSSKPS